MAFWYWLNPLNWFKKNKTTAGGTSAKPTKKAQKAATPSASTASTPAAEAPDSSLNPQCAALTAGGDQCKNSARAASKYCGRHKSYRPPTSVAGAKDTKPRARGALDTAPSARGKSTSEPASRPQCLAVTAAGDQCKSSARKNSKYCGRHKSYRPAAANGAKDTKPRAKRAADTKPASRRSHVTHNGYKLYRKGGRYFFSKKGQAEAKKDGAEPVYAMPDGRKVKVTPNGLPVLKKA